MAELACLTSRAGGTGEVLPALGYLSHIVTTEPLDAASLPLVSGSELVIVDATRDLARAQALCRALRSGDGALPILLVIAEAGLAALKPDWGSSDFVLPSANPAELEARIRMLAQRPERRTGEEPIAVGDLVVDPTSYQVRLRNRPVDLTYKEFELLRFLASRPGRVCTRAGLLQEVWGYDYFGGERTVDVHVRRLRSKLGAEYESMIATVRGVGYKLVPTDQARAERGEPHRTPVLEDDPAR